MQATLELASAQAAVESPELPHADLEPPPAASLCIASGKGGTGKSVVTAALAQLLGARGPTLVFDADLGVGNAHILQDVSPERTLVDVAEGRLAVRDVRVRCAEGVDLVAAGSGVPRMADLSPFEMHLVAHGLREIEREYAHVLVDSAAGVSRQTLAFAEACDATLIVTTPDLTAMTDAYAFLKVLFARRAAARAFLVVNRADDEDQAAVVQRRIADVSERFLGRVPQALGWIPHDPEVTRAVNHRSSVAAAAPHAPASLALALLASRVLDELQRDRPGGLGVELLRNLGFSGRGA